MIDDQIKEIIENAYEKATKQIDEMALKGNGFETKKTIIMDAGIKELFNRYENLVQDYREMYEKQRNLAEERWLKITQLEAENFAMSLKIRNLEVEIKKLRQELTLKCLQ